MRLTDVRMEELDCFLYLGVDLIAGEKKRKHILDEGRKVVRALKNAMKKRMDPTEAKMGMYYV